ncbi:MAG: glycosyltransferase [Acidobacteriaceae bacterium]
MPGSAMQMLSPRIAYFPDSFHEVNGVAHTSRQFQAYAERHGLPFLCVRAGGRAESYVQQGELRSLEHPRSWASIQLEKDLYFDPCYLRHLPGILRQLRQFQPDILHITGPSELGILGARLAHRLQIPLAASWHTNVHEYAARRSAKLLQIFPRRPAAAVEDWIESTTLNATLRLYRLARVLFAPNQELCDLLHQKTGKPCHRMQRGVDTELFSPVHRTRPEADRTFVLGYVGRLSVEKNVALLAQVQHSLQKAGLQNFRFLIVGHGGEEAWLRQHLPGAEIAGVLRGAELSRAYANMDLLVFPSHTDTFGNVVLEALASGVPAIVTPSGGPKYSVRDGSTGFIANDDGFAAAVEQVLRHPQRHAEMRAAARAYALTCSWDAVFQRVYDAYAQVRSMEPAIRERSSHIAI